MTAPIEAWWTGEAFVPGQRHRKFCDATYIIGQRYVLEIDEERDMSRHRSYFATLKEVWRSLPPAAAERFSSPEALRGHALIATGFCHELAVPFRSRKRALAFVADAVKVHEFAFAAATDEHNVARVWIPESQARAAMGPERFAASRRAVLDYVAGLIGVEASELPNEEAA